MTMLLAREHEIILLHLVCVVLMPRTHAFVTVSPIENHALFRPNCPFERCSSVNPCTCFLRTALPKGIEYRRGETNLNSFIHQVMFSSSIIARDGSGTYFYSRSSFLLKHGKSTQTIEITRNENPASNVESTK